MIFEAINAIWPLLCDENIWLFLGGLRRSGPTDTGNTGSEQYQLRLRRGRTRAVPLSPVLSPPSPFTPYLVIPLV